ncbi:hypothetical protein CPB83DRAFT_850686 [Crepidotus variabilis]|uniref:Thiaminase-2/PQQC domain-containing protein n=1 Tax=Crepidotus variabilis TaxID=179855 RepID=A0A9P6EJ54_9AGAR|nr:hypothetical protein CPB83DRAFT_850686 [Crepidotus variabilis]
MAASHATNRPTFSLIMSPLRYLYARSLATLHPTTGHVNSELTASYRDIHSVVNRSLGPPLPSGHGNNFWQGITSRSHLKRAIKRRHKRVKPQVSSSLSSDQDVNVTDSSQSRSIPRILEEPDVDFEKIIVESGVHLCKPITENEVNIDDFSKSKHYIELSKVFESVTVLSRFAHGIQEIDCCATSPRCGASLDEIDEVYRDTIDRRRTIPASPADSDLVARLIHDTQSSPAWKALLRNNLCDKMNHAPATDERMLDSFRMYMIQDFFYLRRLPAYNAERSAAAQDMATYNQLADKIQRDVVYAKEFLEACTDPTQLNIRPSSIFNTPMAPVTKEYLDFMVKHAQSTNWVVGLVALIPCIQVSVEHTSREAASKLAWCI